MPFHESGPLKYFTFDLFNRGELVHGIFSRQGGVSPAPWSSLNLGGTVGDERSNVVENRKRIFEVFNRPVESIFDPWQVHGTEVLCVDHPRPLDAAHQQADAILTGKREITLFMRFADCVPILLYDPYKRVVGLVHAGWRGTVAGIAGEAVKRMVSEFGSVPENILAGVGPSICTEHYPVGDEVIQAALQSFGNAVGEVVWKKNGAYHFDLCGANQLVLEDCGVQKIEQSRLCTCCQNDDWFSHRAEQGKTGRFGVLLALN